MIAYLDCWSGISGDMLLGALIDAGIAPTDLETPLRSLPLPQWRMTIRKVRKGAIQATAVSFEVPPEDEERNLKEITQILKASSLPAPVIDQALKTFTLLAQAEGKVHGVPPEDIHFHEVGALDSLLDVAGVILGFHLLNVDRTIVSPLPFSRSTVATRHGPLPTPAPATLEILKGVPLVPLPVEAETVTPTGAALVRTLADAFGYPPPMAIQTIGYGAGSSDLPIPNVLRLLLGKPTERASDLSVQRLTVLECALDDQTPETAGYLMDRLFEEGALDVLFVPVQMKKSRPGFLVQVLCEDGISPYLLKVLFTETTSLGVRTYPVTRWALAREWIAVETPFGTVRVKVGRYSGKTITASPEYEDCKRLAQEKKVSLKEVMQQALAVFYRRYASAKETESVEKPED